MDWLQFLVGIVSSLAWPATILVIAVLFKTQIAELLTSLESFKAAGVELKRHLKQLNAQTERLPAPGPAAGSSEGVKSLEEKVDAVAPASPEAAMVVARFALEEAIREAAARANLPHSRDNLRLSLWRIVEELRRAEKIGADMVLALREAIDIGNKAAHSGRGAVNADDARSFAAIVGRLIAGLEQVEG